MRARSTISSCSPSRIYDKILYDGAIHTPLASLADDLLFRHHERALQELPASPGSAPAGWW